ncbi:hypothetical protein BUALT_Bualt01G0160400 [Buddleja alternifolia]|uniref:Uncharacterized protein n=1 Tax=Buddleja alternifolia TaxID=168488 RepID=A0AAV6YBS2_9LAMI|nr:hypothetical protein BUALT_Bualt01G0160400 [Buddleja alternifolia]
MLVGNLAKVIEENNNYLVENETKNKLKDTECPRNEELDSSQKISNVFGKMKRCVWEKFLTCMTYCASEEKCGRRSAYGRTKLAEEKNEEVSHFHNFYARKVVHMLIETLHLLQYLAFIILFYFALPFHGNHFCP